MSRELSRYRQLGTESINRALQNRSIELDEEHFERVYDAVRDVQAVLEADLRPRYEAGSENIEELYVADGFHQRALVPDSRIRDAIFKKAGVTNPAVREAVQYTHSAEAKRTGAYHGTKSSELFVLVDSEERFATPVK